MASSIDFWDTSRELLFTGAALGSIGIISIFSFMAFQLAVFVSAFVQGTKHRNVFVILQRIVKYTVLNFSFHTVGVVTASVFLFFEIAWWWLPIIVFAATMVLFYVLRNTLVLYLNWRFRKYLKYLALFKTFRKIGFIAVS